MSGNSKQRIDADNAFLRTQTKTAVRERLMSEAEVVDQARDAKTARLKAQRLEKEAADREAEAAKPVKPPRKPRSAG